jgi:hypothetical protein
MTLHKTIALALGLGASVLTVQAQSFNATGVPLALGGTTTLNPTCGAVSTSSITFNVTGVGTLSPSNQLLEIDMRLRTPGSTGRLAVSVFLRSPSGTCVQIATQMGDVPTSTGINKNLDYKFRAPNACLNKYPDYEATNTPMRHFENGVNSRAGVFSTVGNISTAFNGENADGTWTMYFGRTNSLYNTLPSVQSATLDFGENLPVSAPDPAAGTTCATAMVWNGSPFCATTVGKTDTPNRPGTAGCGWLATSENNLWIQFTPTTSNVCINISGINYVSGLPNGVQSIIVESATPCSGAWTVVNCPRDNIYSSDVGSVMSHNHCFTATPGNTYYLVVDGNAGAITELYLTGISGLPVILPVTLTSFTTTCTPEGTLLNWETATELNNEFFTIETSTDGENWTTLTQVPGSGTISTPTSYSWLDRGFAMGMVYYRLAQTDYDGTHEKLKIVAAFCSEDNQVLIVPNPSQGDFRVTGLQIGDFVSLKDMNGREVFKEQADSQTAHVVLENPQAGCYFLQVVRLSGETETHKVLVR